jgi:hypothetical protein
LTLVKTKPAEWLHIGLADGGDIMMHSIVLFIALAGMTGGCED